MLVRANRVSVEDMPEKDCLIHNNYEHNEEDETQKDDSRNERKRTEKDLSQKYLLTLEEAARYTGVGINKLREISGREDCSFVLWNGSRRLLKRAKLEEYLDKAYSI